MFDWRSFLFGGAGEAPDPTKAQFGDHAQIAGLASSGIKSAQHRQAPQAGGTAVGQVAQMAGPGDIRRQEMGLVGQLGGVASGQQMGAGELAARRSGQMAMGNAIGSATMQRGANAAGGARSAARAAAGIGMGVAGQAQGAAMQDQATARAQQAGLLGQVGARDVQVGQVNMDAQNQRVFQQAGLDQATSLANMQARLQAIGMNDAAIMGYMGQLTGMNQAEMAARLGQEQQRLGSQGIAASLLQAGGTAAAAMSDENLKIDIEPGEDAIRGLLGELRPLLWRYRDPVHGQGLHLGIVAQDMARSALGAEMVEKTADGLAINLLKATHMLMAAVADLHARLLRFEQVDIDTAPHSAIVRGDSGDSGDAQAGEAP